MIVSAPMRTGVAESLAGAPVIGVVRTSDHEEARRQAEAYLDGGLQLVEITFTVPEATELVRGLIARRSGDGPPWIGMGTVTGAARAEAAVEAGAQFIVSPNCSATVAEVARRAGCYLVVGALTPTEIVNARDLGADIVKVYPLPTVGGPLYLSTIRGPLGDIPMLAAGGFQVNEIPAYRQAGASAFGLGGAQLLGASAEESREILRRALAYGRGEDAP
jgi:2-dehydro-3-deoxyphosphogluconate aldolase / (4S)-4-hydroxy-2-oxoglutarate aldolase